MSNAWRRFAPTTLRAQTLLVLTSIFIIAQIASLLIFQFSRDRTVLLAQGADLADRIIGIVELAERFPPEDRLEILSAAETQLLAMYPIPPLTAEPCRQNEVAQTISRRLESWFSIYEGLDSSVCVSLLPEEYMGAITTPESAFDVIIYVDFPDGSQSIFHAMLPAAPSLFRDVSIIGIGLVCLLSLLLGWYLINRALTPLGRLTTAADEIGLNINASAMPEEGPHEVMVASRAFNRMQARLQKLIRGQTEMIAAISHDLRSATTRIQLRVELLKDEHEREGLLRVVDDMKLMVQSVLDYVRGVEPTEKPRTTDVFALLESLYEDLREEGYKVDMESVTQSYSMICRPYALRRCFHNIIDNAIKHGGAAYIACRRETDGMIVTVDDDGPGVPEDELDNILQPFYRLDRSRSHELGGVGLGLSIARNVMQIHGGKLKIVNRQEGGLRVEVYLPALSRPA